MGHKKVPGQIPGVDYNIMIDTNGEIVASPTNCHPDYRFRQMINCMRDGEEVARPKGPFEPKDYFVKTKFAVDIKGRFKFHSSKQLNQYDQTQTAAYKKMYEENPNSYAHQEIDDDGVAFRGERTVHYNWRNRLAPAIAGL